MLLAKLQLDFSVSYVQTHVIEKWKDIVRVEGSKWEWVKRILGMWGWEECLSNLSVYKGLSFYSSHVPPQSLPNSRLFLYVFIHTCMHTHKYACIDCTYIYVHWCINIHTYVYINIACWIHLMVFMCVFKIAAWIELPCMSGKHCSLKPAVISYLQTFDFPLLYFLLFSEQLFVVFVLEQFCSVWFLFGDSKNIYLKHALFNIEFLSGKHFVSKIYTCYFIILTLVVSVEHSAVSFTVVLMRLTWLLNSNRFYDFSSCLWFLASLLRYS